MAFYTEIRSVQQAVLFGVVICRSKLPEIQPPSVKPANSGTELPIIFLIPLRELSQSFSDPDLGRKAVVLLQGR